MRDGGALVSIHSSAENDALIEFVHSFQEAEMVVWIGANDREEQVRLVLRV